MKVSLYFYYTNTNLKSFFLASLIKIEENRLDILLNNAGIYKPDCWRSRTQDNFEIVTMTNYLGHFLLTNLLIEKLKLSKPSRIVNVSSLGHYAIKSMNFEDRLYNSINSAFGIPLSPMGIA